MKKKWMLCLAALLSFCLCLTAGAEEFFEEESFAAETGSFAELFDEEFFTEEPFEEDLPEEPVIQIPESGAETESLQPAEQTLEGTTEEVMAFSARDAEAQGEAAELTERADEVIRKEYGQNWWELKDGILTVHAEGLLNNWSAFGGQSWSDYEDEICTVIVEEGATEIEDKTFYDCRSLKEIRLPEGLEEIGEDAFWSCYNLTIDKLPSTLLKIGDGAFYSCRINKVTIPDGVEDMETYMLPFAKTDIRSITIPGSVRKIPDGIFASDKYSDELMGRGGLKELDEDGEGLREVILGQGIEEIGKGAFFGQKYLKSIEIPSSVREIGDYAFADCFNLENITLHEGLESFGKAFRGSGLRQIVIPGTVEEIVDRAFDVDDREEEDQEDDVFSYDPWNETESLGYYTADEGGLTRVVIKSGVRRIGSYAFGGHPHLTAVTIPASVTEIANDAFTQQSHYFWPVKNFIPNNLVITGPNGSTAQAWAKKHNVTFKSNGGQEEIEELEPISLWDRVNQIVASEIDDSMDDFEKILALHDWLMKNAKYDNTHTRYGPEGVLLAGSGTCESYTLAYAMLLDAVGIENAFQTKPGHIWNMVFLEGQWYHIDVEKDDNGSNHYKFFLKNDKDMRKLEGNFDGNPYSEEVYATGSSYKGLTPAWKSAPKITVLSQESAVEPIVRLDWTASGSPSGFYIYDGKTMLRDVPYTGASAYSEILELDAAGKHSFTVQPYKGSRTGKASSKKTLNVKISWMTTKITISSAVQSDEDAVQLAWKPVAGTEGYEIFEVKGKIYEKVAETVEPNVMVQGLAYGKHTFSVRSVYQNKTGVYGKSKAITTKRLWAQAPKIVGGAQADTMRPIITVNFTYTGEPSAFVFYDGKTEIPSEGEAHVLAFAAENGRGTVTLNVEKTGKHSIKICPMKDEGKGSVSKAKSINVKIPWMTKKISFSSVTQLGDGMVSLNWPALEGIDGYEVAEVIGKTYQKLAMSETPGINLTNVLAGKHSYVVRPVFESFVGSYGKAKTITVKE